ncbi:gamma-aminobutyric acid receptor subunit alpha-2-like [Hydractinia symbiolongicarpus]|uniref:gamma-aminobutyric acid receptor subunit alpha-2-like n=1 Tax=Hydractinia symbiolongicarpus TaxID=13093 RepID=UPI00254F6B82|nr:gamma-aminobutyric acid receptor subunit alpha-2-like [Hydractinia symbiolongicarpus]
MEAEDGTYPFVVGNSTQTFKILKVHFFVKRTLMFHIYRTYIPSILLLAFAFGTFWVPDTAVPARMGMIVTSFLSSIFILQAVSEKTVKVPYTTPMQMFLVVNITLIVFSMVEYIVVLQLKRKSDKPPKKEQRNGILNNGYISNGKLNKAINLESSFTKTLNSLESNEENVYAENYNINSLHWIDRVAQIMVPILYLVYCAIYFGYYLSKEECNDDHGHC